MEAIAQVCRQLVRRYVRSPQCALVIPNDFQQQEQQQILDQCFGLSTEVSLIWLPIATTLAWLDAHHQGLPDPRAAEKSSAELVVIHAGWSHVECTRLQLRPWPRENPEHWLPARRRPLVSDKLLAGFGWRRHAVGKETELAKQWQRLFVSEKPDARGQRDAAEQAAERTIVDCLTDWPIGQVSREDCVRQVSEFLFRTSQRLTAVIVVGDFADALTSSRGWQEVVDRMQRHSASCEFHIASDVDGERFLAHGAAIHLRELARGRTSYLDTLPNLELFVDRRGVYQWLKLLGDDDQVVEGGKQWELKEPITGLSVPRGATRVKLVLAHEEFRGVRELSANLDAPVEQRTPAELHVFCTPAQGNAKLVLKTSEPSRSIPANWKRMELARDSDGMEQDKQTYLENLPRAFPELMPRRSSRSKWRLARPQLKRLMERLQSESPASVMQDESFLREIKVRLREKDRAQSPHDATAIGSDFAAPYDQLELGQAANVLLRLWRKFKARPDSNVSIVIRALGYISVDDPTFEAWLINNIRNNMPDRQSVFHSCGLVLRSPAYIARFVDYVFQRGADIQAPREKDLKAVSQILRYRAEATKEITSQKAEQVVARCGQVFERGMHRGGRGYPFRWSSLVIVYMLRRRMYDVNFLDPDEPLAQETKRLFAEAIERHARGQLHPLGGSVDLPAALKQMIDYIDKKGSGDILMAAEGE